MDCMWQRSRVGDISAHNAGQHPPFLTPVRSCRGLVILHKFNILYLMPIGCQRAKGFDAQNRFTKRFGAPNLRGFSELKDSARRIFSQIDLMCYIPSLAVIL
jgi:hypothetical protein